MTSIHFRRLLLIGLLFFIWPVSNLHAQTLTSATVVGTVRDSTGAVVQGATVSIRQPQTDAVTTTVSGNSGQFRLPFLKPGEYEISAEAASLSGAPERIHLLVGQEYSVDLQLSVRALQQSIEITASNELLQTENGNNLTDYNQRFVENTPINGGDITNVAFSTPGVRVNVGGGNTNFNANGLPFSSVLFTFNGADIVEPYNLNNKSGSSNNTLGANDVAEASVIINAFSAQYGREAGAQVNYISKSGTNQLHGNLVENYNSEILNSNDFFNKHVPTGTPTTPRGRSVANQYAASIGGPIVRDKVAVFVNTEGLRYALPTSGVVSLPSAVFQQYVLENVPVSSEPFYQDLFTLYNSAPGLSRAVPVSNGSGQLQDGTNNLGCGNSTSPGKTVSGVLVPGGAGKTFGGTSGVPCAVVFRTTASSVNTEYYLDGRVDWNIDTKQKLYFRISRDAGVQASSTSPISPLFNGISPQPWVIPQLNYTYMITPSLVNNLVLNGNYYSVQSGPASFAAAQTALPLSFTFSDGGAGESGFPAIGPSVWNGRNGQQLGIIDDLSWERGKHTLQFGVNNRNNRISSTANESGSVIGSYTFGSLYDFAQGSLADPHNYNSFTQSFPLIPSVHLHVDSLGFYGQDEWRIVKNLTLTFGARFEYQENPWCKENCFSRANAEFLSGNYQAGSGVAYNATLQTGISNNFKNLEGVIPEPRVALAYSPFGKGKTVIRGGGGLFANTFAASIAANVYGNAPNKFSPKVTTGTVGLTATPGSAQATAVASDLAFQAGFSSGGTLSELQKAVPAGVAFSTPTLYVNPDKFHTIKALEWSLEVEQPITRHDIVSVSYAGNHGYNEPLSNTAANGAAPNGYGGLPASAPDPRFATVTQILDEGYSRYDGLSIVERHALSHSLQGQASYTWSKALALGTIYNPTVYALNGLAATGTPAQNYGPTNFDTRHNLTGDLVYSTPRLHNAWLNQAAGGWKLGGKLYLYSGRPVTITNSAISSDNKFSSTFSGSVLSDLIVSSALGTKCTSAAVNRACLTTSDFALATAQTDWGNTKPNSFRGPGFFSIAAQLGKEITVHERTHFEIGADAYNLLNHPNFGLPNADPSKGSTFGTITTDVSVPTSIYGTGQGAIVSGRVVVVYGKFIF
jgi:hypothetical protein